MTKECFLFFCCISNTNRGNYRDLITEYKCSSGISVYIRKLYVVCIFGLPGNCESSITSDFPLNYGKNKLCSLDFNSV